MTVGTSNRENVLVMVNRITLEDATVSANGEADDEWVQGDVPFLGRAGFILFFPVVGLGGAVGLFIVSKQMMSSAKQSMANLIGDEGMKKAASVKSDAKAARRPVWNRPKNDNGGWTASERRQQKQRQKNEHHPRGKTSRRKAKTPSAGLTSTACSLHHRSRTPDLEVALLAVARVRSWSRKPPKKWTE